MQLLPLIKEGRLQEPRFVWMKIWERTMSGRTKMEKRMVDGSEQILTQGF